MDSVGNKILTYMKENGIKQSYLSQKTNMNDSTLNAKLNGKIRLSAEELEVICWALNVSISAFLTPRPPKATQRMEA